MSNPLRIGTRGSPLALAQAHQTRARLAAAHAALAAPDAIEIVVIKTTGDRIQDRTLMEAGGKGLFTKEIEEALTAGSIDLAVHSMKDVPTWLPEGLEIRCLLPREDPRDAFFSEIAGHLDDLPEGAVVGTASLRRQAQVLSRRPDLKVVPIRGNVETRLRKLAAGEVDATMLALAGLRRLDMTDRITAVLETDIMLPAVAQGAIGIETRADDDVTNGLLAALDGSCRTPIAALAQLDEAGNLTLEALVADPAGSRVLRTDRSGAAGDAVALGRDAGEELKSLMPPDFFVP
jgi:hydroxymethylbilane synthase